MTSRSPDVDVVGVGGGPTGIVTAALLAKRGLAVRVFERDAEIYDLPRAIVMDDEMLLDDVAGHRFAIVVDADADHVVADEARRCWGDLAAVVELDRASFGGALPDGGAVIVRPDRYVAAVAHDVDELRSVSRSLLALTAPGLATG